MSDTYPAWLKNGVCDTNDGGDIDYQWSYIPISYTTGEPDNLSVPEYVEYATILSVNNELWVFSGRLIRTHMENVVRTIVKRQREESQ